jgi:SAM-dependent methyltransferase
VSRACYLCRSAALAPVIDIGPQPIGNRFLKQRDDPEETFPVALLQCSTCGLVQIEEPVPASALKPPYDWITYNEPEPHLDGLVDILMTLPGIGAGSTAAGVSFKDDSTLARLEKKGLARWRLDPAADLGVQEIGIGVETIQDRLTPPVSDAVVCRRPAADLLLVRHILEHANDPPQFIEALLRLLKPGGYLVVEVPDCSRAFDGRDYTTIWEEHTLYYTPDTFRQGFLRSGLDVVRTENYPYPFENSLVAIARRGAGAAALAGGTDLEYERRRGRTFGEAFPSQRERVRRFLETYRRDKGRIVLFGAGHLAVTFLSVFGVEDLVDAVIDDNPNKRGMFMPGSRLPIVGSSALADRDISLCLLSLNPIGEEKVMANNRAFVERGGTFASIFPASAHALKYS